MRSGVKEKGMAVSRTGVWSWPSPSSPLNPPRVGTSLKLRYGMRKTLAHFVMLTHGRFSFKFQEMDSKEGKFISAVF